MKKSGYTGEFMAFPYIEPIPFPYLDWSKKYKGIILQKRHHNKEEKNAYNNKYGIFIVPLIIIDNPVKRIKTLDFTFDYPEDTSKVITLPQRGRLDGFEPSQRRPLESAFVLITVHLLLMGNVFLDLFQFETNC